MTKKRNLWIYPFILMGMLLMLTNSCKKKDDPVLKKIPVITWANPADIADGTSLSATQLNATADVAGTFVYTPASGTALSVGANQNLKVDFTPTDAVNYNAASKTVKINVMAKKDPIITWANPSDIISGTALSATQLNATADVAGTFVYTPAIGTVLNVGANQNLKVDFTPTDAVNYNTATKTVQINVLAETETKPSSDKFYGNSGGTLSFVVDGVTANSILVLKAKYKVTSSSSDFTLSSGGNGFILWFDVNSTSAITASTYTNNGIKNPIVWGSYLSSTSTWYAGINDKAQTVANSSLKVIFTAFSTTQIAGTFTMKAILDGGTTSTDITGSFSFPMIDSTK